MDPKQFTTAFVASLPDPAKERAALIDHIQACRSALRRIDDRIEDQRMLRELSPKERAKRLARRKANRERLEQ